MSGTFTQEQLRRIEENKRKALAKRAQKAAACQNVVTSAPQARTTAFEQTVNPCRSNSNSAGSSEVSVNKISVVSATAFKRVENNSFPKPNLSKFDEKPDKFVSEFNRNSCQKSHTGDTNNAPLQTTAFSVAPNPDRIEQNRLKALARRAERSTSSNKSQAEPNQVAATTHSTSYSSSSSIVQPDSTKNTSVIQETSNSHLGLPMNHKSSDIPNNNSSSWLNTVGQKSREQSSAPAANTWNAFGGLMQGNVKGNCVLVARDRFEVHVKYCAPLIELFKTMETKLYDAVTKKWTFKLSEYQRFMTAVNAMKPSVDIEPLPRAILQAFSPQLRGENPVRDIPMANLSKVDPGLVNSLMSFQRTGVNFGVYKNGRVLIADDMGLGKTIQAICLACYYRADWPVLVVVPSSVRFDWAQQFQRWVPSVDPDAIRVVVTGKDSCTSGLINIVSYDLMARRADELKKKGFKIVIMDESHLLKNYRTARCKAADPILRMAKRVFLLSGTPALSRPSELYTQISAVCPFMLKFHDFGVRYCDGKQMQWGWDFSGSSNMSELQLLLEETVMIRRLKKDVLSELPDKIRHMVMLDPGSIKISKELKSASKVMSSAKLKNTEQRGALLDFFHKSGSAKLKAVKNYVEDLLEQEKKFLIFAHHAEVLDGIEEIVKSKSALSNHLSLILKGLIFPLFKQLPNRYMRIDGKTNSEQRNVSCGKFQQREEMRVAILSITAANAGLNLSAANLVVFAELFWNPGILVQAEDRAHRIGQQDSVSVQYLVATGTSDDTIWPMIQRKLDVLGKAGLTKDNFSSAETTRLKDQQQMEIERFLEESFSEDMNTLEDVGQEREEEEEGFKTGSPSKVVKQASILKYATPTKDIVRHIPTTPPKEKKPSASGLFKYFSPSKRTTDNLDTNQNTEKPDRNGEKSKPNDQMQVKKQSNLTSLDGFEDLEELLSDDEWPECETEATIPAVKKRKVEPFKPPYAKGKS